MDPLLEAKEQAGRVWNGNIHYHSTRKSSNAIKLIPTVSCDS
jgi:hypothetical protein